MYGKTLNILACRPLWECRKFTCDSVGEFALQGIEQPVYRFETQVFYKKGLPNTIETTTSIYAYQKTRCELEEKTLHRRGCIEILQDASRSACKHWPAWCKEHEPDDVHTYAQATGSNIPTVYQVRVIL